MSRVDENSFVEPSKLEQLPVHAQADSSALEWTTIPTTLQAESGGEDSLDPTTVLHSLRRHWLLSAVLGVILGAIVTVSCFILLPKTYTARSLIQVDMSPEESLIGNNRRNAPGDYDTFKKTQAISLRSPFVLNAALRNPEVIKTSLYKREEENPVRWLQENLMVQYPNNAEFMEVSLQDANPKEVSTIVRAVVDAYMNEVVAQTKTDRNRAVAKLEDVCTEKRDDVRAKRDSLKRLAEQLNSSDRETIDIQGRAVMQEHLELRRALTTIRTESRRVNAELAATQATLTRLGDKGITEHELNMAVRQDVMCSTYQKQMSGLKQAVEQQNRSFKSTSTSSVFSGQFLQQYEAAKTNFEERQREIAEQLVASKMSELEGIIAELKVKEHLINEEKTVLEERYAKSTQEISQIGTSSVDIEIMKNDLKYLEGVLDQLNVRLERARFDLRNNSRIRVRQPAQEPQTYDSPKVRKMLSIVAGLFVSVLPLVTIVLFDLRKRRVNSTEDVSRKIGIPVMGAVPVIPSRAIRRLNSPGGPGHRWNIRLTESIDGISARLLRNATIEGSRTVLITSAVSGEGKTTLAVQIAMSLARTGKRTALVDFDLRRPAIDKAFQLPLAPGVSEALCGEADILDLGQSVGMDNLSAIPAGRCDRYALQALANGTDERIISQLKDKYDFVIIDGSPILPVADTRYVAQHVDMVVMSVFRDLSRTPKVMSAYNVLKSFGVVNVEAVVASPCDAGYGVVDVLGDSEADVS